LRCGCVLTHTFAFSNGLEVQGKIWNIKYRIIEYLLIGIKNINQTTAAPSIIQTNRWNHLTRRLSSPVYHQVPYNNSKTR